MSSGLTPGIDSTLGYSACIDATALVANFTEATVVIDITLWPNFNCKKTINNKVLSCSFKLRVTTCLALTIVAEERSVRTDACNGPGGEGVFHNTLLFSKARVVNSTRVLASGVYACKLGATVLVDFTLWLINNS